MVDNKRGQQGMTIGTLLVIVLGVVAVVVLIIGFTLGTDAFFDLFKRGPSDLQLTASACGIFAQGELYLDYCTNFKLVDVDGEDRFVNCQFSQIEAVSDPKLNCQNQFPNRDLEAEYCNVLFRQDKLESNTKVNDGICPIRSCTGAVGVAVDKGADCASPDIKLTKGFTEVATNACCIASTIGGTPATTVAAAP